MDKAKHFEIKNQKGEIAREGEFIFCPACKETHLFDSHVWSFNGDYEKPTFSPSMLWKGFVYDKDEDGKWLVTGKKITCHSFVVDGNIRYLNDCTHELKGQIVSLDECPDNP